MSSKPTNRVRNSIARATRSKQRGTRHGQIARGGKPAERWARTSGLEGRAEARREWRRVVKERTRKAEAGREDETP